MSTIPDPGPSLTAHDAAAARLLGEMQQLVQTVRGYGSFLNPTQNRRITATASLPTEFLLAVAVALDASQDLRDSAKITGDQIRDVVSFCNAYGPAADEMNLKADGLAQLVKRQRHAIGQVSLRIYRTVRHANLPSDNDLLFPHLEIMKRTLGRGPKKKLTKGDPNAVKKAAPAAKTLPKE